MLIRYRQAEDLAKHWVQVVSEGRCRLLLGETLTKPYGWVFFYQSAAYLKDKTNFRAAALGNAPIIVDRVAGEIRVTGTGEPVEFYLTWYESTLPEARLLMSPEFPS